MWCTLCIALFSELSYNMLPKAKVSSIPWCFGFPWPSLTKELPRCLQDFQPFFQGCVGFGGAKSLMFRVLFLGF